MELISPLTLYCAAVDIQKVYSLVHAQKGNNLDELVTVDDCRAVSALMVQIHDEIKKLNCPAAIESTLKPGQLMEHNVLTYRLLLKFLDEIDGRIRDEVKRTYAFSLNQFEAAFFNPASPLLGPEVATQFESATFDIDEAGKCHALGRSTAAVFHSFRVLEVGIKAMAQCLDVQDLEKPKMKNWGFVLDAVEKAIKQKWPSEADRDSGDGELFWDAYSQMLAMKISRNRTMHPAKKYTEQEADRMLRNIGELMKLLAPRLNEKGEPKA